MVQKLLQCKVGVGNEWDLKQHRSQHGESLLQRELHRLAFLYIQTVNNKAIVVMLSLEN